MERGAIKERESVKWVRCFSRDSALEKKKTTPTHLINDCVDWLIIVQECAEGTQDFRSEQCSRFDGVPFENRFYEYVVDKRFFSLENEWIFKWTLTIEYVEWRCRWVPYTRAPNKCELNCMPKGERFYYRHRRKVIDGTRCDEQEGTDVCVAGQCLVRRKSIERTDCQSNELIISLKVIIFVIYAACRLWLDVGIDGQRRSMSSLWRRRNNLQFSPRNQWTEWLPDRYVTATIASLSGISFVKCCFVLVLKKFSDRLQWCSTHSGRSD